MGQMHTVFAWYLIKFKSSNLFLKVDLFSLTLINGILAYYWKIYIVKARFNTTIS